MTKVKLLKEIPLKKTILVVDDTPANIDVLDNALKSEYRIKVALSGEQALVLAESSPLPDMILKSMSHDSQRHDG